MDTRRQHYISSDEDEESTPQARRSNNNNTSRKKPGLARALRTSIVSVWNKTRSTPDAVKDVWKLARWETQNVRCWRTVIFFLLLITGAFVSSYTYLFLKQEQNSDFESNYDLFTHRIKYALHEEIQSVVLASQNFAKTISGAATSTNSSFPFVSVPLIEIAGYTARHEAGVDMFCYTPIVTERNRAQWQLYAMESIGWLNEGRGFLQGKGDESTLIRSTKTSIRDFIWQVGQDGSEGHAFPAPYLPVWQTSPPPAAPEFLINYNMLSVKYVYDIFTAILVVREGALSNFQKIGAHLNAIENAEKLPILADATADVSNNDIPRTIFVQPVFEDVTDSTSTIAGLVHTPFSWLGFMENILPRDAMGVYVVLKNTCDQEMTFQVMGQEAIFVGHGDLHETSWDHLEHFFELSEIVSNETLLEQGHCVYSCSIYPSDQLRDVWHELTPIFFSVTVAGSFLLIALTFIMYDRFVIRRNEKVIDQAARTNKIIASLFPSNVRDRLLEDEGSAKGQSGAQTRLKNFLANDGPSKDDMEVDGDQGFTTRPIADLFHETTVVFSDIAGFTSWSSAREPNQVFVLLETIYRAFDEIAKVHNVYKVETIGDCYVAVTGLPEARPDHAVAMSYFALDCLDRMQVLVKKLEVHLGPDTADLAMRMGLHSGPVTAGVLRGDRSRFQLFGDTVNYAAKMESSGKRDHIQISNETADILISSGKGHWVVPREDSAVNGERQIKTFWLQRGAGSTVSSSHASSDSVIEIPSKMNPKTPAPKLTNSGASSTPATTTTPFITPSAEFEIETAKKQNEPLDERLSRRVDWVAELLIRMLKQVVAKRGGKSRRLLNKKKVDESYLLDLDGTVLEEVQELIRLPKFDPTCKAEFDAESVVLDPVVPRQVRSFVTAIATMYRKNPFHNFEHASHVTMSVSKLMARIVAPSDMDFQSSIAMNQVLHDHTYGITSDPLTQFACVLSALIHDVDHTGVPNTVLLEEDPVKAKYYKGRSVAEQNSVDLAWEMLMQQEFKEFRETLYTTKEELIRFRQLVVNSVMATDIMDKELKELRNARWTRAFNEVPDANPMDTVHRKGTIIIEHLIQASDVAHTMQHWHIYRKWNERLFLEMYKAYKAGRTKTDPTEFWYKGEIGFFDFYIIPLAKKLKDCGVFGVSSDEYLNYALKNKREWEARGQEVVEEYKELVRKL